MIPFYSFLTNYFLSIIKLLNIILDRSDKSLIPPSLFFHSISGLKFVRVCVRINLIFWVAPESKLDEPTTPYTHALVTVNSLPN